MKTIIFLEHHFLVTMNLFYKPFQVNIEYDTLPLELFSRSSTNLGLIVDQYQQLLLLFKQNSALQLNVSVLTSVVRDKIFCFLRTLLRIGVRHYGLTIPMSTRKKVQAVNTTRAFL